MKNLEFNQENWDLILDRMQYLRTEVKKYKYDHLTGLRMRKDFDGYLTTLFEMYEFEDRLFTLVLVDVVNLHNTNRTLGYTAGDNLIKSVVTQLQQSFKECNGTEVFRVGGDEFTVLIKGYHKEKLENVLASLKGVTFAYTVCDPRLGEEFASPSHVFKLTDQKLIDKKSKNKIERL
jgi:GGDEF domain-containing protein